MLGTTNKDRGREAPEAKWWPISEAQARYGASPSTIRRLVAEERIDARKLGPRLLVNDASASRYFASLPRAVIKPDERSARLASRLDEIAAA